MKGKIGLRLKFILIFLIASIIITVAIVQFAKLSIKSSITEKYRENAISIASLVASIIDGDELVTFGEKMKDTYYIDGELQEDTDEELIHTFISESMIESNYTNMKKRIDNIKSQTETYFLYVIYPYDENYGVYIYDGALTKEQVDIIGGEAAEIGYQLYIGEYFEEALKVMKLSQPSDSFDITNTQQGDVFIDLASTYAPILNEDGQAVAFVGIDVTIEEITDYVNNSTIQLLVIVVGIVFACMVVLITIIQLSVIKPVRILKQHAEEISAGKFGNQIHIKGRDEISEISEVFNRMSKSIEGQVNEIQVINDAYYKYVPSKIFELLDKSSVTQVQLGNQVNVDLTVLNMNVVGFRENMQKKKSKEMFSYINRTLNNVLPYVIENEGVVETFQEAGFSAFYNRKSKFSLDTAISMCQKINALNHDKSNNGNIVELGIGITYGTVMLGIVGHDQRLSTISISVQTRVAQYLQSVANDYSARIIITGSVADRINKFDKNYHSRFIGFIYNSTTEKYEKLYDVFDGDDEAIWSLKASTKEIFERGVNYYCSKKFYEARVEFIQVIKSNRHDKAARVYLDLCNQYYSIEHVEDIDISILKF